MANSRKYISEKYIKTKKKTDAAKQWYSEVKYPKALFNTSTNTLKHFYYLFLKKCGLIKGIGYFIN
jgi:hypothetical protein